jgi:hypothetical protein
MKPTYLIIVFFLFLATSCQLSNGNADSTELVKAFYKGLNQSDFKTVSNCIGDTILINEVESNFALAFSKDEYHDWFLWDSTFNPKYEIAELEVRNDSVFATISKNGYRIQLLHETPLVYKVHFDIADNKLVAINRTRYVNADWTLWQSNRDKFMQWVARYYPDCSDFMSVQNKEFGAKYLKVLHLYLEREKQN